MSTVAAAVDVVSVEVTRDPRVRLVRARLDGHDLAGGAAPLPGHATSRLDLRVAVDCARVVPFGRDPDAAVRVIVRTPLGTTRTRDAGSLARAVAAPCPGGPIRG